MHTFKLCCIIVSFRTYSNMANNKANLIKKLSTGELDLTHHLAPHKLTTQEEIQKVKAEMKAAYLAKDYEKVANYHCNDCILTHHMQEPIRGRDGVRDKMRTFANENDEKIDMQTERIMVFGKMWASERGIYTLGKIKGSYLTVWHKEDHGWKVMEDSWTTFPIEK